MTENKRYFERRWEGEYYIFDSEKISEKEFDEKLEYEDYKAFEDSVSGDEVVTLLNEKEERILKLENKLNQTALELLNYEMISMGKAVEISEMSYINFLKYRKEHGNPMELQL